jgi:hypothetical protein
MPPPKLSWRVTCSCGREPEAVAGAKSLQATAKTMVGWHGIEPNQDFQT